MAAPRAPKSKDAALGWQPQAEPYQELEAGIGDNGTAADATDTPPSLALALGGEGLNPFLRGGNLQGVEKISQVPQMHGGNNRKIDTSSPNNNNAGSSSPRSHLESAKR